MNIKVYFSRADLFALYRRIDPEWFKWCRILRLKVTGSLYLQDWIVKLRTRWKSEIIFTDIEHKLRTHIFFWVCLVGLALRHFNEILLNSLHYNAYESSTQSEALIMTGLILTTSVLTWSFCMRIRSSFFRTEIESPTASKEINRILDQKKSLVMS